MIFSINKKIRIKMKKENTVVNILNDLIKINIDRITGYEKAIKETPEEDTEVKKLFDRMAEQSREYRSVLNDLVRKEGAEPADDRTFPGKIYQIWMELRASFASDDEKTVLALCEFGEDAALRAYDKALDEDQLPAGIRQVLEEQRGELKASHQVIKWERDLHKAL
jgi:uncharacterized protein (TIGR02284 family)